jgi:hypothetical protein
MSNVKTVSNCPNCQTKGTVIEHKKMFVELECPSCKKTWQTLSPTCKNCKKPNGFASEGPCSKCYSEGFRY